MAFAGIIEFTRMASPTSIYWDIYSGMARGESIIWDLTRGESKTNDVGENDEMNSDNTPSLQPTESEDNDVVSHEPLNPSITTISDFIIGGSLAGALFKGSAVRTRVGARIDASIMGISKSSATSNYLSAIKGKPLSGLFAGAVLGLFAGVTTVAVDHAQVAVEEYFGHADSDDDVDEIVEIESEDMASIPADIKAMSNEEMAKEIENLKRGMSESYDENGEDAQAKGSAKDLPQSLMQSSGGEKIEMENMEETEIHDLISVLGFRPHPSH